MQKESVWIIIYVLVAIGAFLSFLIYGNFLDLAISLVLLPIFFILMFRIKKISLKLLLRSLVGTIIIQILAIAYYLLKHIFISKNYKRLPVLLWHFRMDNTHYDFISLYESS